MFTPNRNSFYYIILSASTVILMLEFVEHVWKTKNEWIRQKW